MNEERRRILDMLANGKINAEEAERLLDALGGASTNTETKYSMKFNSDGTGKKPHFLHVQVKADPEHHSGRESVDVKIPLILLKTGMKLKSLLPEKARTKMSSHLHERGIDIDFDKVDSATIDNFINALTESSIDIDSDKEQVKIFCS